MPDVPNLMPACSLAPDPGAANGRLILSECFERLVLTVMSPRLD